MYTHRANMVPEKTIYVVKVSRILEMSFAFYFVRFIDDKMYDLHTEVRIGVKYHLEQT